MRLFVVLLLVLVVGLGWALWQGIDLATTRLAEATAEERGASVSDGVDLTVAEEEDASLEVLLESTVEPAGAAMQERAQDPAPEAPAEAAPTSAPASQERAAPSPEAAPETTSGTAEEAAPEPSAERTAGGVVTREATPTVAPPVSAPALDARRITGDQVNLREGADADTASLGLLSLDQTVEVLEEDGDWMRVRTDDGEEGRVAAQFVAAAPG